MKVFSRSIPALMLFAWAVGGCETQAASSTQDPFRIILRDRPQLASLLESHREIKQWIAREISGASTGLELFWDPSEPYGGQAAEHEYPRGHERIVVIRVSRRISTLDQLAGLVYELHNARGHTKSEELHEQALNGSIDRIEYARRALEQEFHALVETRALLSRHLTDIPDPDRRSSPLLSAVLATKTSLKAHLEQYEQEGYDLLAHFESVYDKEVAPHMRTKP